VLLIHFRYCHKCAQTGVSQVCRTEAAVSQEALAPLGTGLMDCQQIPVSLLEEVAFSRDGQFLLSLLGRSPTIQVVAE
jgi:hypothetical protein